MLLQWEIMGELIYTSVYVTSMGELMYSSMYVTIHHLQMMESFYEDSTMRKRPHLLWAVLSRPYWVFGLFHRLDAPPELASQSRTATYSSPPTASTKAHTLSASHPAVFARRDSSQDIRFRMMSGSAAAAFPASLARARARDCKVFSPTLSNRPCLKVGWGYHHLRR